MKAFQFSLERMRGYKNQVLDGEKNILAALRKQLADLEGKISRLLAFQKERQEVFLSRQREGVTMGEANEFRFCLENARLQLDSLYEEREALNQAVEAQRQVVIVASQEVASLDKLEEKQLEEYQYLEARDREKTILEQVTVGLSRRQPTG
ncbi:MAG: flagellar FliJ family protein [Peptococcaceae bacterium]|nr:flagellar FliJ family protein [Peptococcaceae bacterium]